jgi:hypothetical protein
VKSLKNIVIIAFLSILLSASPILAQFEQFVQNYGVISTIAGKGDFDDKGVNGWTSEYEGGLAVDAELSRPHFVMADSSGAIYIADKDAHAIRKLKDGRIFTVAGTSVSGDDGDGVATEHRLHSPNGMWVRADGVFYILDLGNSKIRKVTQEGMMSTLIDDPGGISLGRGLWVSDDEKLVYYSSGNKIRKWSQSEGITIYATGFSQLGNLVVDPTGHVVATDRGANVVYRVFDDGSKIVIAGNGHASGGGNGYPATETGIDGVRGIWFLPDSSFLLATHEGSQIWYVDNSGIINLFLDGKEGDEYHSGDGEHFRTAGDKISEARSISVDYLGHFLIAENDRGFIRKIQKIVDTKVDQSKKTVTDYRVSAFPNPFNSRITIQYEFEQEQHVVVEIYDILGNRISTLAEGLQKSGTHKIYWNAIYQSGSQAISGTYFYAVKTDSGLKRGKIVYLK